MELPQVDLVSDLDNLASRRVIEASGGVLVEAFRQAEVYGGGEGLLCRINLPLSDRDLGGHL